MTFCEPQVFASKTRKDNIELNYFFRTGQERQVYVSIPFEFEYQFYMKIKPYQQQQFVWCRRNADVSYKQEMNELLASVVVCYFKEVEFKTKNDKHEDISQELWQNHLFFNSVEYAESDIFSVFQKIRQIQGDMYKTQVKLIQQLNLKQIQIFYIKIYHIKFINE